MPKIARFHSLGGPENLIIEEMPPREPAAGEVKLRIHAVGLNRAELMFMQGSYLERPQLPSQIGVEGSGIVEKVGPGVDSRWVGQNVATIPGFSMSVNGVLGEEAVVPVTALAEYPINISSTEAAAIWMQYLTAYGALVTFSDVKKGDFVLITAASSSVGLAAIQIVNAEGGISIAATRKSNKRDQLIQLGAAHVIATEEEELAQRVDQITGGKGARIIFDPVAGPGIEKLADAAGYHAIIFEYGNLSMQPTPFPLLSGFRKGLSIRAYSLIEIRREPEMLKRAMKYVYDRLADGVFHPKIAKIFPFADSADAYAYMASNQQVGKIIIRL